MRSSPGVNHVARRVVGVLASVVTVLVVAAAMAPVTLAADVDPALVGTWQLDFPGSPLYWTVRADGVYRMHGPGANPKQLGRLAAQGGKFSMVSAVWVDSGTYRVNGNSLGITGKLGPGTWKRVWAPGQSASTPGGPGACSLVSPDDAAQVLGAPVIGGPDVRAGDGGCLFRSTLSNLDNLTIRIRRNQGQFFQNLRRSAASSAIDVPGVGEQAWAKAGAVDSIDELAFLRGDTWVTISGSLQPGITRSDLPALAALARAIDRRLSGFRLPEPQLTDKQRDMIERLEETTRRNRGK